MAFYHQVSIFISALLASQVCTNKGNVIDDSVQLTRASSTSCTGKEVDRDCIIGNTHYFSCTPGECEKSNFQECEKGMCRTCALQRQYCNNIPCCDSQQVGIAVNGVRPTERHNYCFGGKCTYCINYNKKCRVVGNIERELCCNVPNIPDVSCRPAGQKDGYCMEDPCPMNKKFSLAMPNGFAFLVPRCDGNLGDFPKDRYDFECQGVGKESSCVRCLAYRADCSGGVSDKCCPTYLKCTKIQDKNDKSKVKHLCLPKCGPQYFKCSADKECCKGLKCRTIEGIRVCAYAKDDKTPITIDENA